MFEPGAKCSQWVMPIEGQVPHEGVSCAHFTASREGAEIQTQSLLLSFRILSFSSATLSLLGVYVTDWQRSEFPG